MMSRLLEIVFMIALGVQIAASFEEKVCLGTNGRWSVPVNPEHHYKNLKNRFTNCTYVNGNVELTWLQDPSWDLSFLEHIREVTGYVLISHVDLPKIVLPRLQIIRGQTLLKLFNSNEEFALLVTTTKMHTLELPSLREVLRGNIGDFNNVNFCHGKNINWKEICSDPNSHYVHHYNVSVPQRKCPPCHQNCVAGCWGEGEANCQKFSKEFCSSRCSQGRCFGLNSDECCHKECVGGCNGPNPNDCFACKKFEDDGVCKDECPPMKIYNPIKFSWEANPNGKYAHGSKCVKSCPEYLLKDDGACVKKCPPNKKDLNGECQPCNGPCPKTCIGDVLLNAGNIDTFKGCTVIQGYLHIIQTSFSGYQEFLPNLTFGEVYPALHPDRLEVFSTVKEITGFLDIQASHPDFKNLSYFRNLEVIGGRTLFDFSSSLYILRTSLESLGLRSLRRINSGTVAILENENLCFADTINWSKIRKGSELPNLLQHNRNAENCSAAGLICDEECTKDGCWGKGADECLLSNCDNFIGFYLHPNGICEPCHDDCDSYCTGPGLEHCTSNEPFSAIKEFALAN